MSLYRESGEKIYSMMEISEPGSVITSGQCPVIFSRLHDYNEFTVRLKRLNCWNLRISIKKTCRLTCKSYHSLLWAIILFIISEGFFFISFFWAFCHRRLSPTIETESLRPPMGIFPLNPWSQASEGPPIVSMFIVCGPEKLFSTIVYAIGF